MVFFKKNFSPKFGNYLLHLIIVSTLNLLTLLKLFLSLFENYEFAQILEIWRENFSLQVRLWETATKRNTLLHANPQLCMVAVPLNL